MTQLAIVEYVARSLEAEVFVVDRYTDLTRAVSEMVPSSCCTAMTSRVL